jgi:hypothetical protein
MDSLVLNSFHQHTDNQQELLVGTVLASEEIRNSAGAADASGA